LGFPQIDTGQNELSPASFYESLLQRGENSYLGGEFEKAIRELEIAAFGLFHKNRDAAKAYILMGLSYFHLEDLAHAEESLNRAAKMITEEELETLGLSLDESDKQNLRSLVKDFGVFFAAGNESEEEKVLSWTEIQVPEKPVEESTPPPVVKTEPEKKDTPAKVEKPEENQIEGLEELFILDPPSPEGILAEIKIQRLDTTCRIYIVFQPYTRHGVFEITDEPPNRIVIDIPGITGLRVESSIKVDDFGIASIRTGMYKPTTARVVFDAFGELPPYRVETSDRGLLVIIDRTVF